MERYTLTQRTKRNLLTGSVFIGTAMITGCGGYVGVVAYQPPPPRAVVVVEPAPAPAPVEVVADGPVVSDPGVVLIDVEPDPAYRVYVYDPGFPPGTYFYSGFYYYGGYRYPHDVFINRYVTVNIREHRFADERENRQRSMAIEAQHRRDYAAHSDHNHFDEAHARPGDAHARPGDAHARATDPHARPADPHARPAPLTNAERGERQSVGDTR